MEHVTACELLGCAEMFAADDTSAIKVLQILLTRVRETLLHVVLRERQHSMQEGGALAGSMEKAPTVTRR